jgi:hypothetical protein
MLIIVLGMKKEDEACSLCPEFVIMSLIVLPLSFNFFSFFFLKDHHHAW